MAVRRPERRAVVGALLLVVPLCVVLGGCFRLGPASLNVDQIDYSRALTDAEKTQTLLNIVRLRYGDTPTFLNTSQVIAGYQLQQNLQGGFEWFPSAAANTFLGATGMLHLQESPTFTFQPVGGDAFAQSFLRPLPPDQLLPLVMGAVPIDLLLRMTVESIASLQNSSGLSPKEPKVSANCCCTICADYSLPASSRYGWKKRSAQTASLCLDLNGYILA
jgi:hypothetical protein